MTSSKFHKLFNALPRKQESELTQFHMDLAASIQVVTEEIVLTIKHTGDGFAKSDIITLFKEKLVVMQAADYNNPTYA